MGHSCDIINDLSVCVSHDGLGMMRDAPDVLLTCLSGPFSGPPPAVAAGIPDGRLSSSAQAGTGPFPSPRSRLGEPRQTGSQTPRHFLSPSKWASYSRRQLGGAVGRCERRCHRALRRTERLQTIQSLQDQCFGSEFRLTLFLPTTSEQIQTQ